MPKSFVSNRSGAGAAHLGWSMFGARSLLCVGEDGSPGGGAPPPPPAPGTPPGEPSPKTTFTQEEVNRLVGAARQEGRQAAAKTAPPAPPTPSGDADDEKVTLKSIKQELEETKTRQKFEKRAAKLGITDDDQLEDLYVLYKAQKPDDDSGWFDKKTKSLGIRPSSSAATAPVVPPGSHTPPISDKGPPAPGGLVDVDRALADNPLGMDKPTFDRLAAKHGVEKARRMQIEAVMQRGDSIKVLKPQG